MAGLKGLQAELKERLGLRRYLHTRGVARTARRLALRHHLSADRAELAGWLHDCAKELPAAAMKRFAAKAGADKEELTAPPLWHAPAGAWMARTAHGVRDAEVLKAIRFHSTGAPRLEPLQKLLFIADYIEPGRPAWPGLPKLRRLALRSLDLAYAETLRQKIMDLLKRGRRLHPRALAAWNEAISQ